ncbi:MAG: hypothetical protein AAGD25_01335 [Cyanobacteria bacterium P01_F01_bin.150]
MTETLGIIDFVDMIYQGHPEYTLIAVKAPLEKTIQAFITVCQTRKTRRRFDVKATQMKEVPVASLEFERKQNVALVDYSEAAELSPAIPFVALKDSAWTVVPRSLFYANDEIFDVPQEAKALS